MQLPYPNPCQRAWKLSRRLSDHMPEQRPHWSPCRNPHMGRELCFLLVGCTMHDPAWQSQFLIPDITTRVVTTTQTCSLLLLGAKYKLHNHLHLNSAWQGWSPWFSKGEKEAAPARSGLLPRVTPLCVETNSPFSNPWKASNWDPGDQPWSPGLARPLYQTCVVPPTLKGSIAAAYNQGVKVQIEKHRLRLNELLAIIAD